MNFQTAAVAGGAAFLLSFLAGLIGGVPFFDILVRALVWGVVGFAGCLGIEALLRSLVPDLFTAPSETVEDSDDPATERMVDITLGDDDRPVSDGFIEEVDDGEIPAVPLRAAAPQPSPGPGAVSREPDVGQAPEGRSGEPVQAGGGEEEMPEIGSFLDAFKPGAPEEEGDGPVAPSPDFGDYAPVDQGSRSSGDMTHNGEVQDPVILAKAVQTVMKRDGQGS